ncbi:MAG: hypothetical protein ABI461_10425, partial [Polyangiaceae bacterium]
PLSPAVHYVTLLHPNAAAEKRSVKIVSGEVVLLEATMNVTGATTDDDAGTESEIDAGPTAKRGEH